MYAKRSIVEAVAAVKNERDIATQVAEEVQCSGAT